MLTLRACPILLMLFLPPLAGSVYSAEQFHWQDHPDRGECDLFYGEQPVVRYVYTVDDSTPERHQDTTKVFHHVFGPGTQTLLTKGPGGLFPHHRGLYVGWNKTSFEGRTEDFWHFRKGETQRHVKFESLEGSEYQGKMTALIEWNDVDGKLVIEEHRTLYATRVKGDAGWQLDWSTKLISHRGEIQLDGDRQHAGFQYRASQQVADSKGARYVRPAGFPQQPEAFEVDDRQDGDKHSDLNWTVLTYELDGERFNIEYLQDPRLPKPSRYSERPYGRFGAFFSTTITPEKPLEMQYRIIVTRGETPTQAEAQTDYEIFLSSLDL